MKKEEEKMKTIILVLENIIHSLISFKYIKITNTFIIFLFDCNFMAKSTKIIQLRNKLTN
jgi:hypothetical protein